MLTHNIRKVYCVSEITGETKGKETRKLMEMDRLWWSSNGNDLCSNLLAQGKNMRYYCMLYTRPLPNIINLAQTSKLIAGVKFKTKSHPYITQSVY